MEIELDRKYLSVYTPSGSGNRNIELSADVIVPDSKADMLRIIMSDCKYKIVSKDTANDRVKICGEAEIHIIYTEEGGGISTLHKEIPFDCEFEAQGVDISSSTFADIRTVSCEVCMLNTRKALVKAVVCVQYRSYRIDDFTWYEAPQDKPDGVFFKTESSRVNIINNVCEKSISLQDEFKLDEFGAGAELIYAYTEFSEHTAEAVGSKLIIKGKVAITIIYSENNNIRSATKNTTYSQVFDISERDIIPDYTLNIVPAGDYYELYDNVLSYEIHAVMQIVCSTEKEISYICDAYACKAMLNTEVIKTDIVSKHMSSKHHVKLEMNCDEEGAERICAVNARIISAKRSEDILKISAFADIIYACGSEIKSVRLFAEQSENDFPDGDISSKIVAVNPYIKDKSIEVVLEVQLIIQSNESSVISMIASAEKEDLECHEAKAPLYLVKPDDLWTLAKKYSSDIELIKKLNDIEDGTTTKKLLLIPTII